MAKNNRRKALIALANRRAALADRQFPRLRRAIAGELARHVRDVARLAKVGATPAAISAMPKTWAREMASVLRGPIRRMVFHGFQIAADETGGAKGKSSPGAFRGKSNAAPPGVDVGEWERFIQETDWRDVDRWVGMTAESASETSATRLRNIMERAAGFQDTETGRGMTPVEIAKQILAEGLTQSESRARMLAHTGAIWGYNEGAMQRYDSDGITVVEWLTAEDDLRCPFCATMNGKKVETKEPFMRAGDSLDLGDEGRMTIPARLGGIQHPPLHPNCLTEETPVTAPDKRAAFVAAYSGPIVELRFTDGRRLSVTPNHMLLTPFGFSRAASLRQGDDVIDCSFCQRIVGGRPDDDGEPSMIRDVVDAFAKTSGVTTRRVPASREYLHGDGSRVDGDVHIIAPDGLLQRDAESAAVEFFRERQRFVSDLELPSLRGRSDLRAVLCALALSTDGGMRVRGESQTFARRHTSHAQEVGFPNPTSADAVACEPKIDDSPTDTEGLRQTLRGFAGQVTTAKVSFIEWRDFHGHVYDLQTMSSLYLANGVVSSNCRCTLLPVVL